MPMPLPHRARRLGDTWFDGCSGSSSIRFSNAANVRPCDSMDTFLDVPDEGMRFPPWIYPPMRAR